MATVDLCQVIEGLMHCGNHMLDLVFVLGEVEI